MSNTILDKFNAECTAYLRSKLQTHLLSIVDPTASCQYYFTEYQRCVDEQRNVVQYMEEQLTSLEALKSCETTIDAFFERLKAVHQYERKQNEIFEQILHQLNKANTSNKEELLRLLGQIDELIVSKAKLTHPPMTKLPSKSSDTFKNIL